MLRILHCIRTMGGGGAERQLVYLAEGLAGSGWEVHVAILCGGPNLERLRASGAIVHELTPGRPSYLKGFRRLIRLVRELRPAVLQTWLHQMDILGGLTAIFTGVPFIVSERSSALGYPGVPMDRARLTVGRGAALIVANSEGGKAYWVSKGRDPAAIRVIRNGIPFEEIDKQARRAPRSFHPDPGFDWIVYAGRYSEEKNLEILIDALEIVFRERSGVRAVFFGEGPQEGRLIALRDRKGLGARLEIKGYTTELWEIFHRARVFVSASRFEGHPNTVLEAVACRCPVVVSEIEAHREFLDMESAWFVPAPDPERVARTILSVLENREAACRKAENAYAGILHRSTRAMTREYIDAYREVAVRKTARSRQPI